MRRMLKRIWRKLFSPMKLRYEMPNGNIDNLGEVLQNSITKDEVDSMMRMCRSLALIAEYERPVKVYGYISNDKLNYELVGAMERGEVRYGLRGYFSVTERGLQVAVLMPDGGKVEFLYAR